MSTFYKAQIRFFELVILFILVSGCASKTVRINDVIGATEENSSSVLKDKSSYRLDYLIDGKKYSYSTFEVKGKYTYFQLLVEEGKIVSSSEITLQALYSPEIRRCTLFPYHDQLNVQECLLQFNHSVLESNNPNFIDGLTKLNRSEKNKQNNGAMGTLLFAAILSPILVPAAVMALPLSVYDYASAEGRKQSFQLELGHNTNLDSYLASLDQKLVSKVGSSGTAYLESGIIAEPTLAFGFLENDIVWIQRNPRWTCGGGFMFWGHKCTVGKHNDDSF